MTELQKLSRKDFIFWINKQRPCRSAMYWIKQHPRRRPKWLFENAHCPEWMMWVIRRTITGQSIYIYRKAYESYHKIDNPDDDPAIYPQERKAIINNTSWPLIEKIIINQLKATMKFWDRVDRCNHKNINPDYSPLTHCRTPYCDGTESHCLDCGVYITECQCNTENGMSGWSRSRWDQYHRKRSIKAREHRLKTTQTKHWEDDQS